MTYRECGWVADVEVLSKAPEIMEGVEGEKTTLKVIKTIQESRIMKKEARPADGAVFSVWAAKGAGSYAGWSLDDF